MLILCLLLALSQQDDAAATQAVADFDAAWSKSKDSATHVAEVGKLAQTQHEKVVARLAPLLTNEDKAVRTAAASGLGSFTGAPAEVKHSASKALITALTTGANLREVDIRVGFFAALGKLEDESSGTALRTHFDDKDVKIAGAAMSAAGAIKSKAMIEPLIEALRDNEKASKAGVAAPPTGKKNFNPKNNGGPGTTNDPEAQKRERASALVQVLQGALQELTKQQQPTGDDWEKWWTKNRATFTVPK